MIVTGGDADRVIGLIAVLFFGFGGVAVFALPLFTRRGRTVVRTEFVRHRGTLSQALVFPYSRAKQRLGTVATLAFAVAGVLAIVYARDIAETGGREVIWIRLVGLATAALFGSVAVIGFLNGFLARGYVALLPEGILNRAKVGSSFIPWDAIEEVRMIERYNTRMVGVVASDPRAIEISALGRLSLQLGRSWSGADLLFPANALAAQPELLLKTIAQLHRHPEERSKVPAHAGL
jgi:hypothetical protein